MLFARLLRINNHDISSKIGDSLFLGMAWYIVNTSNKTIDLYLSKDQKLILVSSSNIEQGSKKSFFAFLNKRGDGIVVKLSSMTESEKKDDFKQLLAEITMNISSKYNHLELGKTNLEKCLLEQQRN